MAGTFYPADPVELASMIDDMIAGSRQTGQPGRRPKALIVPHAGYVYSGPVAASAYARLVARSDEPPITRVVLLGPAHRIAVRSMAVSSVDGWATPLGTVPLDDEARRIALGRPGVVTDDRAHGPEHSLEVQVPFLQRVLGDDWSLLPVVVGGAKRSDVAGLLGALWGGPETLVIISTDLSHYHDDATAKHLDALTSASIIAGDANTITPDRACGAHPLRGLLDIARARDLTVESLDLRNSSDTAGDPDRVVGYGAFALH